MAMFSSKQLIFVLCATVWLVVNLSIWPPLRGALKSWTVADLNNIANTQLKLSTSTITTSSSSSTTTSSSSSSTATTTTTGDSLYPQFMLLGDSITERSFADLVPRLSKYYSRRMDVINRGFGGYTSADGLRVLPSFFPATLPSPFSLVPQVRLMTVFFGANDATLPGLDTYVPLATYEDNLRQIVNYEGLRLHSTKVIFITPPPVDEHKLWNVNLSHTAEITAQYAAACCRVAASLDRPCLDLWSVMMTKAGWKGKGHEEEKLIGSIHRERSEVLGEFLIDGLHLSSEGYLVLWQELKALIETKLPSEIPQSQALVHPIPPALLDFLEGRPSEEDDS